MTPMILALQVFFSLSYASALNIYERAQENARAETAAPDAQAIGRAFAPLADAEIAQLYFSRAASVERTPLSLEQHAILDNVLEKLIPFPRDESEERLVERIRTEFQLPVQLHLEGAENPRRRMVDLGYIFSFTVERMIRAQEARRTDLVEQRAREVLRIVAEAFLVAGATPPVTDELAPPSPKPPSQDLLFAGAALGTGSVLTIAADVIHPTGQLTALAAAVLAGSLSYAYLHRTSFRQTPFGLKPIVTTSPQEDALSPFTNKVRGTLQTVIQRSLPNFNGDFEKALEHLDELLFPPQRFTKACVEALAAPTQ